MSQVSIAGKAKWLDNPDLQALLEVLCADGEDARIAGGAVRNTLLGQPVADIDIATTTVPDETVRRAESVGFHTVPTGIEHGTVTVIAGGRAYEVTTLRADVDTDGRRAKVVFGRDWKSDAERRDFTINALYAKADGTVVDLVGGQADLDSRTLRFIGDAEQRIREDYLRILRFFRFFAWYGHGRPDAEGVKASARLKEGLDQLSAERVWSELKKLLGAADPSRALLWARQAGVLSRILPESEKWGIDAIHALVKAEQDFGWKPDALLRLAAIVPPDAARMDALADRLKLSSAERTRLVKWAGAVTPKPEVTEAQLGKEIFRGDRQAIVDRLRLALASARGKAVEDNDALIQAGGYSRLLAHAERWKAPAFPLKGGDLLIAGAKAGPAVGKLFRQLQDEWVDAGFAPDRSALLERAAVLLKS
jgi:tRNA nucleotidyltransferase/poly(A) polymerase